MQLATAVWKSIDWILRNFIVARLYMEYPVTTAPQQPAPGPIPSQLCATYILTHNFFKAITIRTAVAHWLRCCATNRKVAGSIPAGVSGFLIDIKSFRSHYGPGVVPASNINEYQEYFLGVKAAGA